jgi:hypothetical protein
VTETTQSALPKRSDDSVALSRKTAYLTPRLEAGIASALVRAAEGQPAEARKQLDALLAQSKKLGFVGYEFEARLELGRLARQTGQVATGQGQLASLEQDARAKGFLLISWARDIVWLPSSRFALLAHRFPGKRTRKLSCFHNSS